MANTYDLISKTTVGSGGAANIEFTSIPATYTDLLLKTSIRNANNTADCYLRFNSATTNFSDRWLYSNGSSAASITNSNIDFCVVRSSYSANMFSNTEIYIPNYTSSNYKPVSVDTVTENNDTTVLLQIAAGLWSNTASITSIQIVASSGNIAEYSTAYLYGISNA